MKLENQVTSLKLSKKLKELGVAQESLWCHYRIGDKWGIKTDKPSVQNEHSEWLAAFTVAEINEKLPNKIYFKEGEPYHLLGGSRDDSGTWYYDYMIGGKRLGGAVFTDKSEANAGAKMLIYLIENKLVPK